jgi:hypothetical protein
MTRSPSFMTAILALVLVPLVAYESVADRQDHIGDSIQIVAGTAGVTRVTHRLYRDWLNRGAHQYVGFKLEAGMRYFFVGACDRDCADLDFELFDPDGILVGHDTEADPTPVVSVMPEQSGSYRLKVTMFACAIEPCEWGVRGYRR